MKRFIILLCIMCLLLSAGCSGETGKAAPELMKPVGIEPATVKVQRDTVYRMSTYDAVVVPDVVEVYFTSSGTLDEFQVNVGDLVEEGQVLATLQVETYQKQLDALDTQAYRISQQGIFSDRQKSAQIEIAKVELEKLQAENADTYTCQLKALEIQRLSLELEQQKELRTFDLGVKYGQIQQLQERIDHNQLVAPLSGRVVYIADLLTGSPVQGYDTVLCIADESRLTLQTDFLNESALSGADRVYAKILDKEYDVAYLPFDQNEFISAALSGKTIPTHFSIEAPAGEVESGQYAVIVAVYDYKENVLTIPANALYRDQDGRHVYKVENGQRIRCSVEAGIITDTRVEILEGLKEGDVVCVSE